MTVVIGMSLILLFFYVFRAITGISGNEKTWTKAGREEIERTKILQKKDTQMMFYRQFKDIADGKSKREALTKYMVSEGCIGINIQVIEINYIGEDKPLKEISVYSDLDWKIVETYSLDTKLNNKLEIKTDRDIQFILDGIEKMSNGRFSAKNHKFTKDAFFNGEYDDEPEEEFQGLKLLIDIYDYIYMAQDYELNNPNQYYILDNQLNNNNSDNQMILFNLNIVSGVSSV